MEVVISQGRAKLIRKLIRNLEVRAFEINSTFKGIAHKFAIMMYQQIVND